MNVLLPVNGLLDSRFWINKNCKVYDIKNLTMEGKSCMSVFLLAHRDVSVLPVHWTRIAFYSRCYDSLREEIIFHKIITHQSCSWPIFCCSITVSKNICIVTITPRCQTESQPTAADFYDILKKSHLVYEFCGNY